MTELVLPNDTNMLFNLMGGKLMQWMDIVAAISAQRHSNRLVVTASVDNVSFKEPIKLGYVVTLKAQVTRSFRSSMEVHIQVWAEDVPNQRRFKSNEAYLTFVALDNEGKPVSVPVAVPNNDIEKHLFTTALNRRELRLVLAGKMKPSDAEGLRSMFTEK
ncbi:MAG: acyl-CoA thioesterase [Opitutaceae bacterium]|nr:acyl-CoA thioesterase [Cytophagales bacterium]